MLPVGWTYSSIGQVTLPVSKIDPKDDQDREIDYIDISSIDNTLHVIGNVKQYRLGDAPSRARQIVRAGDVLFATVRPYLRNIARVPNNYDRKIASTGFSVLRPAEGVCPAFLFYKAISREMVNALSGLQYGVSYPAVKDDQVRDQPLWLPPTEEQHRIAAKIDELFSELDKGVESLETARAQLKIYRQAVLKHAFEGKLTGKWREENKDKLEEPEQLIARIEREREGCYEQQLKEWATSVRKWKSDGKPGRKPRKPSAPNPITKSSVDATVRSDKLPFGWTSVSIASLFDVVSGATPKGLALVNGSDVPFYKVSDMNTLGNETRMGTAAIYLSESERNELGLKTHPKGTVIFPKRGGAILTNKKRILSRPSCFDLNTMGVVNRVQSVSKEYLWHWFQSLDLATIYDGSNVPQINKKNVEPLPFPICSIEEQRGLASLLEKTLSHVDETEVIISHELQKAGALRQSILRKAFSGELVPQDSNDEPASVLLDRIRAEREQNTRHATSRTIGKRKTARATT